MIVYQKRYRLPYRWDCERWTIEKAERLLPGECVHITARRAELSEGGLHDYYSNGDYWWPDPAKPNGLPYIHRDGQSNPANFMEHRIALRRMRTAVAHLAAAYRATKDERFAGKACRILKKFFVDEATYMAPHLTYAQALPGICSGRGIGIIDTLHLVDVPFAIEALKPSGYMTEELYGKLKLWFAQYLEWMMTYPNGHAEMNTTNNHAVCFFVQAAAFARFTENEDVLEFCRLRYQTALLGQMAQDGSFPRELGRTKPYSYSMFVMDNMVTLCHLLSSAKENLWEYTTGQGQNIVKGLDFIMPFVMHKEKWPYGEDVEHFESWPARQSFMFFAGLTLGREEYLEFYFSLPVESTDFEVRRNIAIRQPVLLL
jgi:hypothetical protein